ncbi:response regulator [Inmirania thermothiophila]|uniref:Two-component system OmpR family response regulator n=1 Tax=Inmirania thermothiophila TaxID=1750597 RepID=A0A3N1XS98_9GAMM|nr:response regulator [Inmirania thermothiophila]ROR29516.1 two-component system OmpR family response regulator [Inmirania thermothiophila]
MERPHVLVVDDDPEIRALLAAYLERNGLRASTAEDGRAMWRALAEDRIDLVILDLMLPGEDGLTLCRDLRARSSVPVIMLTARGEETDRIVGLEMGADDYVAKPFSPRELLARIKAVLRRAGGAAGTAPGRRYRFAGWTLDAVTRQLTSPEGTVVPLSGAEYRLLRVFLERPGRVLARDRLLDLARGREAAPFDRSIDVLVSRLRRRLGDDGREPRLIRTVRGEGYVLAAEVEVEGR